MKRFMHFLAHLFRVNGCVADSMTDGDGRIWLRHVCATCGKPMCDWWRMADVFRDNARAARKRAATSAERDPVYAPASEVNQLSALAPSLPAPIPTEAP
jgi:hypothetical protein